MPPVVIPLLSYAALLVLETRVPFMSLTWSTHFPVQADAGFSYERLGTQVHHFPFQKPVPEPLPNGGEAKELARPFHLVSSPRARLLLFPRRLHMEHSRVSALREQHHQPKSVIPKQSQGYAPVRSTSLTSSSAMGLNT